MVGLLSMCLLTACTPTEDGGTTTTTTTVSSAEGNILSVVDYGAVPDSDQDATDAIEKAIGKAQKGDTILFPKGTYRISSVITVAKKGITLLGEEALLLQVGYDNTSTSYQSQAGFFYVIGEDITIKGFDFDYEDHVNVSGLVTEVNSEESYFVVNLFDEFLDITGEEYFNYVYSHDADGAVNGHVAGDGGGIKFTYLGEGKVKVWYAATAQLDRLQVGEGMTLRLANSTAPLFSVQGAVNTVFEDCTVYQGNMVWYVATRGENITFNRCRVTQREGSQQLMVTNTDIIHVDTLVGKLIVKDCQFDCLGDDALNVHTRAGKILDLPSESDPGTFTMVNAWNEGSIESYWGKAGDTLEFYDKDTLLLKGTAKLESLYGTMLTVDQLPEGVNVGDAVANISVMPAVEVTGTTISRGRARGLLLQTRNVKVENCNINRMSSSAILLACDYARWFEMGPSANIYIANNTVEKCSIVGGTYGGIVVKASHDTGADDYPAGVHNNIEITGNTIKNSGGSGIFVSATKGLTITNNTITNAVPFSGVYTSSTDAITLVNCEDVTLKDNVCDEGVNPLNQKNCVINSEQ